MVDVRTKISMKTITQTPTTMRTNEMNIDNVTVWDYLPKRIKSSQYLQNESNQVNICKMNQIKSISAKWIKSSQMLFEFFYHSTFSARSWQNIASIDIEWVAPIESQCSQASVSFSSRGNSFSLTNFLDGSIYIFNFCSEHTTLPLFNLLGYSFDDVYISNNCRWNWQWNMIEWMQEERRRSLNIKTMHSKNFKKDFTANTSGFLHDPIFTKLKKLTPIILFIALLLFFISYGSPYWAESTSDTTRQEHIGLWRFCSEGVTGQENCDDFINLNYNGQFSSSYYFEKWYTLHHLVRAHLSNLSKLTFLFQLCIAIQGSHLFQIGWNQRNLSWRWPCLVSSSRYLRISPTYLLEEVTEIKEYFS